MPGWAARYTILMLLTGLRKSDALRLEWEKIGPDRIGPIRQGKTKRYVVVPITSALAKLLDSFPGERKGFLFKSPRGGCYSPKSYANHFYAAIRATGIENRTVHDLRRTFATRAYNEGVPPRLIAELLGQRDTRLVQRYTHAEFATLAAMAERATGSPQIAAVDAAVAERSPEKP